MAAVETGEEKDDYPRRKKDGERDDVQGEELGAWDLKVAQCQRRPQREREHSEVAQEEYDVFPLGDQRHILYYYIKYGSKQAPDLPKSETIGCKSQSPWGAP